MGSFIIKDVRIFTGEDVIQLGNILVKDGLIEAVGNNLLPFQPDIPTIDGAGKTALPGLIDAHIHADKGQVLALEQSLRFGVTTVLDMFNEPHHVATLKKIARARKDVADFKSACFGATIDHGWPAPIVLSGDVSEETVAGVATWPKLKTVDDIEAYVEQNIKDGADYIKLIQECGTAMGMKLTHASSELQTAVVKAAHRRGLLAVAHATCYDDTLLVLKAGVDGTTHTFLDRPPTSEIIEAYQANNAWCNPTLTLIGSLTGDSVPVTSAFANDERVSSMLGVDAKENLCRCMHMAPETCNVDYAYESVRQLKAAGIDIVCGTDAAGPCPGTAWGTSIHHELFLLVDKCGFSPLEALRSATGVTSRRFRLNDRGIIAPGRKADLVLVEGNPLDNIGDLLNLEGIWRDGVMLKKSERT